VLGWHRFNPFCHKTTPTWIKFDYFPRDGQPAGPGPWLRDIRVAIMFFCSRIWGFWYCGLQLNSSLTHSQYACVAASWSAHTQDLEVDVKVAESLDEVMRLAAPCQSDPSPFPCAVGINTSSALIFSENSMLDAMVTQASAGAVRALPYGLFAFLVSRDDFLSYVGGVKGDGADESGVSARSTSYHTHNRKLFTDPDVQLTPLSWPATITDSALHSSWLAQAAIDAWLSVVPFPYVFDAHAVVDARSSSSFSDNSSHAIGANGRQCFLADIHIDRALYYLNIKDYNPFLAGAWFCIDLSSICLFSALNLKLQHPSRDRVEMNFMNIYWKLHIFDRTPLPPMPGCDACVPHSPCINLQSLIAYL
jgi:hypothetical protein